MKQKLLQFEEKRDQTQQDDQRMSIDIEFTDESQKPQSEFYSQPVTKTIGFNKTNFNGDRLVPYRGPGNQTQRKYEASKNHKLLSVREGINQIIDNQSIQQAIIYDSQYSEVFIKDNPRNLQFVLS